jgi:hypothetical protein
MVMADQEHIPFVSLTVEMVLEENCVRRLIRFSGQGHQRFVGCKIAFLRIALFACGNQVRPAIQPATPPRKNMIDRKVPSCAAVLALEIVALEYIFAG